jgi:RNA-directed DNA polymerase
MPLTNGDSKTADGPALGIDGHALQSAQDVAEFFDVSQSRLIQTLYRAPASSRYHEFEIPKRSGGMRKISAPRGLVRDMQDQLAIALTEVYAAHPSAHGFISARSVVSNAANHTGKHWVLNVDLADFFPSINFGRVRGLFMAPPFNMGQKAAAVMAQICIHGNGLPQGAPTSPILSNFIAASLDRRLTRLAREQKCDYSRYADDITFSTNHAAFPPALAILDRTATLVEQLKVGDQLERAIMMSGFSVHPKKVRLQGRHKHQSVTGLCVNRTVNVERERIRKIRAMLHAWEKFGLAAAGQEYFEKYSSTPKGGMPIEPGPVFRSVVYGQLAFVKMVRGPSDPVFLKLCAKLIDLDPNPSKFVRQMVFGAADYDIFISHASEDKAEIARPIYAACEKLGLKTFLDEDHIAWGQSFTKKINTALGSARTILAIVSSNSVTKEWPLAEMNTALGFEVDGKKNVIAVMVGRPDLSHLPLMRGKRWIEWNGDAVAVAKILHDAVKCNVEEGEDDEDSCDDLPISPPSQLNRAATSTPAVSRAAASKPSVSPMAAAMASSVAAIAPKQESWLSRMMRKK